MFSSSPNFSVTLKSYGKIINVPVFKTDTISTLIDRIEVLNPHDNHLESRESISEKVLQSLDAVLQCSSIPLGFKKKIELFLESHQDNAVQKEDETQIKEEMLSNKSHIKKLKRKESEEQRKKDKRGEFTQLYKMTKNIFSQNDVGEAKESLIKMRERHSRIKRPSSICNEISSLHDDKENDIEIMKRIEEKILSYERNNAKIESSQHKSPNKTPKIESTCVQNKNYSYATQVNSATAPVKLSKFGSDKMQIKETKMNYNYIDEPGAKSLKYEYNHSQISPPLNYLYTLTIVTDKKASNNQPYCSENLTFYGGLDMRKKSLGKIEGSMILRDEQKSILNDSSQNRQKRFNYF